MKPSFSFSSGLREKNFPLCVKVLEELTPLFFALDHVNYSRWMPVHIRDMKSLPATVRDEFEKDGHWPGSFKDHEHFFGDPI